MLKKHGISGHDEQHWQLTVPDEHCVPGLEVGIIAQDDGLSIGGGTITD